MKAVIIAAGFGSRLWDLSNQVPKTLLPYANGTILSTIITQLKSAGIGDIGIVVGYNQEYIRKYVAEIDFGLPIQLIENLEWDKGNGLSVYKARNYVKDEPFVLSMSDHVVTVDALKQVVESKENTNLLLVDPWVDSIHDIDDATKVYCEENRIVAIGKEIPLYNGIDCGVFRLESDFFDAVETVVKSGNESISGAIQELIANKRMKSIKISNPLQWLDIDTPDAYEYGLRYVHRLIGK
ncbi:MAG TPA: sugar phosphate nucleotidyltransferase [Candidatus Cloacimonadota bacterium]|nr:sugar phosphate nucleotidyltransferase [Candidatus Cloacimonadota bacterium]HPT71500.1 sugar phosphate nucleotidyltransferase [Candidatus Cloacimonadota bacterium]